MIKSLFYKIKTNSSLLFLLKLARLFAIIFVLDYTIGYILKYFYFKQESGMQYRTTYAIEKTTAEVLILGSSRANHHYHPEVFEKRLNPSYYNAGRDANILFYHYAVLKGILKRYSPKIVILDFENGEFRQNKDSYDRISSLLPYYAGHPEMRSIICLKSKFEKLKMMSKIYPYNSELFTIAIGNLQLNKKRRGDIEGYVPFTKILNEAIQIDTTSVKYALDSTKIEVYKSFIQDCLNAKVKLYIVCSPYFLKSIQPYYSITIGREIAKSYNVRFYDFSKDSIFITNPKLFADLDHLNDGGARIFSNMLIDSISKTP